MKTWMWDEFFTFMLPSLPKFSSPPSTFPSTAHIALTLESSRLLPNISSPVRSHSLCYVLQIFVPHNNHQNEEEQLLLASRGTALGRPATFFQILFSKSILKPRWLDGAWPFLRACLWLGGKNKRDFEVMACLTAIPVPIPEIPKLQ